MSNFSESLNQRLINIIEGVEVNSDYLYSFDKLIDEKITFMADNCANVLDFGKSSRELFNKFSVGQITTVDINQFDGYPDVIDDICDIKHLEFNSYEGIICMSILEHVYMPHKAVENLHYLLKENGFILFYAPFLLRYHAPKNLVFQDYFRFTRDGLAYLFRDFSNVTLYPVRGKYSGILSLLPGWKSKVEKRLGQRLNKVIDHALSLGKPITEETTLQTSGYILWAQK